MKARIKPVARPDASPALILDIGGPPSSDDVLPLQPRQGAVTASQDLASALSEHHKAVRSLSFEAHPFPAHSRKTGIQLLRHAPRANPESGHIARRNAALATRAKAPPVRWIGTAIKGPAFLPGTSSPGSPAANPLRSASRRAKERACEWGL